ncbi:MAG: hypothetical protein J1E02_08695 [Coprobacter sp.]|nr:hypothetical protein [Coprobacter sp.]
MSEKIKNLIVKSSITIALTFGSMIVSVVAYLMGGLFIGTMLHSHEHECGCACDASPVLTENEAIFIGFIYVLLLITALFFLLRKLKFSREEQIIAMIILFITNLCVCSVVKEILTTQVSG